MSHTWHACPHARGSRGAAGKRGSTPHPAQELREGGSGGAREEGQGREEEDKEGREGRKKEMRRVKG